MSCFNRSKAVPLALAISTAILVGCGGGGGGGGAAPVVDTSATVSLSGTAAKGLMANADVSVFAVNADGSLGAQLVTTPAAPTTDSAGHYSLSFVGTQGQPAVVKITANSTTTHADEATGTSQPLPAGFAMRVAIVPSATGAVTTSANVTPFTEMSVAAASKASGGLTAANVAQSNSTIKQMLGIDPATVKPTTAATASNDDEKRMAVLLTAVSQMAKSDSLGCAGASAGATTQCVVGKLADAASTSSIGLTSGSGTTAVNLSAKLATAVTTVLGDNSLTGSVNPTLLSTALANLGCTGTDCNAATTGSGGPTATATAIAGAKLFLSEIKSDWVSMFSSGGVSTSASGALNQQALKFKTAMDGAQPPVETMIKDVTAMIMGIDLYNDFKAGRTTNPTSSKGKGGLANDGFFVSPRIYADSCSIYQTQNTNGSLSTLATASTNANFIGCSAYYYASYQNTGPNGFFDSSINVTNVYVHGFAMNPKSDGSFAYSSRARRTETTCTNGQCVQTANEALQLDGSGAIRNFFGTATPILSAAFGAIKSVAITGDLPAGFMAGSPNLTTDDKEAISVNIGQTTNTDGSITSTVSGNMAGRDKTGATQTDITFNTGSFTQIPVSFDANGNRVPPTSTRAVSPAGFTLGSAAFDIVTSNAGSSFEGNFSMSDRTWDKSQTDFRPTKMSFTGTLSNTSGTVTTDFLKGALTVFSTGFGSFDTFLPNSSTNNYVVNASFVGSFTAPSRPLLQLSWSGSELLDSAQGSQQSSTLQYRSVVSGTPKVVVDFTGSKSTGSTKIDTYKLSEASSNVSMTWADHGNRSSIDLFYNGTTKIGTLNTATGVLTFTDGSFLSVDIGL